MNQIRIIPDSTCQGEGISKGLARGLLVYYADQNLTGEGMGIGSVAFRNPECTYFFLSWMDSSEAGVHKRTFTLDTRMRWSIYGRPSDMLTRHIEFGIRASMQLPRFQGSIMLPVPALSTLLGIHPLFETIPSRGKVTYSYRVTGTNVEVQVEIITPVMPQDTLCLSNELSAAWFTAGWDGERPVSPPPLHQSSEILDRLPLPDRSGFDHHQYQSAMEKNTGLKQTSLIVTRGCPVSFGGMRWG